MPTTSGKFRHGFSLVEILLSLLLIAAILIILLTASGTLNTVYNSNLEGTATKLASRQIESLKKEGFENCCSQDGTTPIPDPQIAQKLPDGTGTQTIAHYIEGASDIKLVSIVISWNQKGVNKSVELETILSKNGI